MLTSALLISILNCPPCPNCNTVPDLANASIMCTIFVTICSRTSRVGGFSVAACISSLLRGKRRGMARGKTWHGANERRRLQRLEAGKTPRTCDGKGRARGRAAWNLRRALARARARLQGWLIAQFGLKPLRRLRGKQPRHALNMASMKVLAKREEASMKVLDSPNKAIAIGWPIRSRPSIPLLYPPGYGPIRDPILALA